MSFGHGVAGLNEVGGIFAGVVAVLATVGGGLRWLFNWRERRQESRAGKLQAWHDELKAKEQRLDAERENEIHDIKQSLEKMSGEHRALFRAYHILVGALVRLDPMNPALKQAAAILETAFKVDAAIPADMASLLARVK